MTTAQKSVFAGLGNRALALLLDLILVVFAASLVPGAGLAGPISGPIAILALALLYFGGMPLSPLQGTLGKWVCRIKICSRNGQRLRWRASIVRAAAMLGWCLLPAALGSADLMGMSADTALSYFLLVFFLPWAPAGFLPRGESLFDLLAGSVVVRFKAGEAEIASVDPAQKPALLKGIGGLLLCLLSGVMVSVSVSAQRDMNRRARVGYAIEQTGSVREKIEAFYARERRWPSAAALGVAEWSPYRDGGGYRVQADGSVVISFSVLPELKGRSITFRPVPAADGGKIEWQCSADAGLKRPYLPASCR